MNIGLEIAFKPALNEAGRRMSSLEADISAVTQRCDVLEARVKALEDEPRKWDALP